MREIKFRAWDTVDKQMFNIKSLHLDNLVVKGNSLTFYSLDDVELMQYTGLKDKNGVEIYEGDIVESDSDANEIYKVVFDREGRWSIVNNTLVSFPLFVFAGSFEIIGNIYENPELLETKKTDSPPSKNQS